MCYIKLFNEYYLKENGEIPYKTPNDLLNLLNYIFRCEKTQTDGLRDNSLYYGDCCGSEPYYYFGDYGRSPEDIFNIMSMNHMAHFVVPSTLAYHRIISFHASEMILPQNLDVLGRQIARFYADHGHFAAYAVHSDSYNLNIHIVVDSVNYNTGNMLHIPFEFNTLQVLTDNWQKAHDKIVYGRQSVYDDYEDALFGKNVRYGRLALTAKGQIKLNKRQKEKQHRRRIKAIC